jgi:hypothetical protein
MRSKLVGLFFVIMFAPLSEQKVFAAQESECTSNGFDFVDGQDCQISFFYAHFGIGGGWKTVIRASNDVGKGPVQLVVDVKSTEGIRIGTVHEDSVTPQSSSGLFNRWLYINQTIEISLLSDCDNPDGTTTGSLFISYKADRPEWIAGLIKPTVQFNHISGFQGFEPVAKSSSAWRAIPKATADGYENFGFALGNPGRLPITVRGVISRNGITLGSQEWTIPSLGARSMYITSPKDAHAPGFGGDPFSNSNKDFIGILELQVVSPSDGEVVAISMQFTGNSMSTGDMQQASTQPQ